VPQREGVIDAVPRHRYDAARVLHEVDDAYFVFWCDPAEDGSARESVRERLGIGHRASGIDTSSVPVRCR